VTWVKRAPEVGHEVEDVRTHFDAYYYVPKGIVRWRLNATTLGEAVAEAEKELRKRRLEPWGKAVVTEVQSRTTVRVVGRKEVAVREQVG
jgi:hypothetical protein